MFFPGDDYQLYLHRFIYPSRDVLKNWLYKPFRVGVNRFIENRDVPSLAWLDYNFSRWQEYVYCDIENRVATRRYPGGITEEAGVWDLKEDGLEELINLAHKYDRIYVWISFDTINAWKKYALKFRWIYELQNALRDRLSLIPYGFTDYEIMFCLGMAGGGINASTYFAQKLVLPDGRPSTKRERGDDRYGVWQYVKDEIPDKGMMESAWYMLKRTSKLNKEFYEQMVNKNPDFNVVDRKEYAKLWPAEHTANYMFCHNFRNLNITVKNETYMRHSKHSYSVRGDQHRFIAGDGLQCNTCSLNYCCKLYEKDGVCVVGNSDGKEFADKFKTGDLKDLIAGMQMVVGQQAEYLQSSFKIAEEAMKDNKEVPKYIKIDKQVQALLQNSLAVARMKDPLVGDSRSKLMKLSHELNEKSADSAHKRKLELKKELGNDSAVIEGETVPLVLEDLTPREQSALIRRMEQAGFKRELIARSDMVEFLRNEQSGNQNQLGRGDVF